MKKLRPPISLFGIPLVLARPDARQIVSRLEAAWLAFADAPPGDLEVDLARLRRLFDPVAQGSRLRKEIASLRDKLPNNPDPFVGPPLILMVEDERMLITPEGRVALEILRGAAGGSSEQAAGGPDRETVSLSPTDVAAAEHFLLESYRPWLQQRLLTVVALQSGTGPVLHPAAIGLMLLLLVNRSTSEDTAITRASEESTRRLLDSAMAKPIAAFADELSPGERRLDHFSTYSGYPLTEARRRLNQSLSPTNEFLYVRPGEEKRVMDFLAKDLARRRGLTVERLSSSFEQLVAEYRMQLATLASLGLAFERPGETERIRTQLLTAFVAASR